MKKVDDIKTTLKKILGDNNQMSYTKRVHDVSFFAKGKSSLKREMIRKAKGVCSYKNSDQPAAK